MSYPTNPKSVLVGTYELTKPRETHVQDGFSAGWQNIALEPQTVEITTNGYWLNYSLNGRIVANYDVHAAIAGNIHSASSDGRVGQEANAWVQTYPWMFAGMLAEKCSRDADGVYHGEDFKVTLAEQFAVSEPEARTYGDGRPYNAYQLVERQTINV